LLQNVLNLIVYVKQLKNEETEYLTVTGLCQK